MDDGVSFIDPEDEIDLRHYASKYYDPKKAHEYYLRTRELKGRQPAKPKLSKQSRQNQAAASAYVRDQVRSARTRSTKELNAKSKALMIQRKNRLEKLQKDAKATRERISKALADKVKSIMDGVATKVPKPKLNEIPASASPKQREYLERQNAKLTNKYNRELAKAQGAARTAAGAESAKARAEVVKLGNGLKAAVAKARDDYAKGRAAIANERKTTSANLQRDLKTELKNIQDKVR